jgi:hypothetical protein
MYPLEVSCRRGCCLANDARRKTCVKVEPAAPGGDQLVPNRRRRLPLMLPCACFALLLVHKPPRKLAHRRFYHHSTLLPVSVSHHRVNPASSCCSRPEFVRPVVIRLTGQNCTFVLQKQQHTTNWPRLLSAYFNPYHRTPPTNNTPLSLNTYTHTAPVEGKHTSSHGKQVVALLHRLWFAP